MLTKRVVFFIIKNYLILSMIMMWMKSIRWVAYVISLLWSWKFSIYCFNIENINPPNCVKQFLFCGKFIYIFFSYIHDMVFHIDLSGNTLLNSSKITRIRFRSEIGMVFFYSCELFMLKWLDSSTSTILDHWFVCFSWKIS